MIIDETNQFLRSTTHEGTKKNKSMAPEANHTQQVKLQQQGQQKRVTCFAALLRNVLKSDDMLRVLPPMFKSVLHHVKVNAASCVKTDF